MAYRSFFPQTQALGDAEAFFEAYTWRGVFPIKETINGVLTPVNMQEYDALAPIIIFKNAAGGTTTGCPTGVCTWSNAAAGEITVDCTQTQTDPSSQIFSGVYEIYVQHDTEEDSTGVKKRTMVYRGSWSMPRTLVASS